ncbi:Lrp/AsnC family transcriptional regulator [Pseudonocardia spinosispora]|uniref:Lrp/AsnC family transcriptional regulator n=1 Tax=Pseudonocardia spinosispora TaxID=103441 RepID=UPI00048E720A|nr:Lrp/AsnC family transcriptional regulator [Pseudonocardia spinosispora]
MDEVDSAIVAELQRDARQTNRDLAGAVGVAPSTCLERVRLLRQHGVITGYTARIDLPALNRRVQALITVQVRPLTRDVIDTIHDSLVPLPEVLAVFVLAGGDDFLVHVAVQDIEHLQSFLLDRLSKRREIISFRSSVIYQHTMNQIVSVLPGDPPSSRVGRRPT